MLPAKYRVCVPRKQYAADKAGAGTTFGENGTYIKAASARGRGLAIFKI